MSEIEYSHTVQIIVRHRYGAREVVAADLLVAGDGSIDHMVDSFQAALVAAGFSTDTAGRLNLVEPGR